MVASLAKVSALTIAVLAASTKAHNQMTVPVATWPEGFYNKNSPSGTIDAAAALPIPSGMSYTTDQVSNTKAYWTAFNASKYKTLKELAWATQKLEKGASKECGFSLVDGEPQELPDKVEWDGFIHYGPCEVHCDDKLVFQNWNCAIDFKDGKLPYDKAACAGASVLTSYWIGLHTTPWQIYTNCAPIKGGGAGGSKPSTPAADTPTQSDTPSTPTETETETPSATPTDTATPPAAPSPEPYTPDTGDTSTPATPPADKCAVRRRRR
ncbi:uncharacterized protein PHALS_02041 [Plasmopara halstedii]|uniref:RxLR-like protein n=1 Tax=Plasmopara halstedii TaxID=4781 RepID=A0A0P1AXG9_PLAHL|nr:uncharacterized protein PHALS_02041 [Plasmopara halstedii]CEG45767.1 hypothetical protein PHALS_02041 [Plasmopara halstedii]|eukprot:XP_024582136.1 hypothetical protein PHALS_02041 [Plasmopara halstedii]